MPSAEEPPSGASDLQGNASRRRRFAIKFDYRRPEANLSSESASFRFSNRKSVRCARFNGDPRAKGVSGSTNRERADSRTASTVPQ